MHCCICSSNLSFSKHCCKCSLWLVQRSDQVYMVICAMLVAVYLLIALPSIHVHVAATALACVKHTNALHSHTIVNWLLSRHVHNNCTVLYLELKPQKTCLELGVGWNQLLQGCGQGTGILAGEKMIEHHYKKLKLNTRQNIPLPRFWVTSACTQQPLQWIPGLFSCVLIHSFLLSFSLQ